MTMTILDVPRVINVYGFCSTRSLIVYLEGFNTVPYRGENGHLNIGVGHNVTANGLPRWTPTEYRTDILACRGQVSRAFVMALLDEDVDVARSGLRALRVPVIAADSPREAALVSMIFNLGQTRMSEFDTFLGYVQSGMWEKAAADLSGTLWARQLPQRVAITSYLLQQEDW